MRPQDFKVNIIGLSQKAHRFDYEFGVEFFEHYGRSLLDGGHFKAVVTLDKRETMIEGNFQIQGSARLTCDRSLEEFDYPMDIQRTILFKYGPEEMELSDEIVLITHEQVNLDVGQFIYELIGINLPMKRLHPRFRQTDREESQIELVYSSPVESKEEEQTIDPRWEKLKKLK